MVLGALKNALYCYLNVRLRRYFSSKRIYNSPIVEEICHYATCIDCAQHIKRQGWKVGFREEKGVIREVFFIRDRCPQFNFQCFGEQNV